MAKPYLKNFTTAPFKPLDWQIAPWRDKSPIVLLTGSAGGGKSKIAAEKIHAFMMKYPGSTGLAVRKTRSSMINSTVLFLDRSIIGRDPRVRHYPSYHRFEYWNGSILAYGGMRDEDQREQIRSIGVEGGLDFIWGEEAVKFTEPDLNELLARLRGTAANWFQAIFTTNPGGPTHPIKKRFIDLKQANVYLSSAKDNPYNPPEYLKILELLTGLEYDRLVLGKWVQAEGLVYAEFDLDNIVEQDPDPDLPVELAFDDGWVDPRAVLFIQRSGSTIHVFDEIYISRELAEVTVDRVVDMMGQYFGYKLICSNCDNVERWIGSTATHCSNCGVLMVDDNQKPPKDLVVGPWQLPSIAVGSPEAKELQARFRRANIPVRKKAIPSVVEAINNVRPLIRAGDGYRALKVNGRCKNFINELTDGYRYPEKGKRRDSDKPLDENNHACDAFRDWAWLRARTR
jgi:phage terminase large subunit